MVVLGAVDLKGMIGGRRRRAIRRGKKRNKRTSSFKVMDRFLASWQLDRLAPSIQAWYWTLDTQLRDWDFGYKLGRVFYKLPGTSTGKGGYMSALVSSRDFNLAVNLATVDAERQSAWPTPG